MSKRNISTTVTRETVIGGTDPLSWVSVWTSGGTVHLDASAQSGQTTHRVGFRVTQAGGVALAKQLVKELGLSPSDVGLDTPSEVEVS